MNKVEYYQYLKKLVGDTSEDAWDRDSVFALFQSFRPEGKVVEVVFEPLENGAGHLSRVLEIFSATSDDECAGDMYFVVRKPLSVTDDELRIIGDEFITKMRELSTHINDDELNEYLQNDLMVEFGDITDEDYNSDSHLIVYEIVGDWLIDQEDFDSLASSLGEAFYSMACDYWIAYYLQWPGFKELSAIDVFKPYVQLWKHGMSCVFTNKGLKIGKRN